jgi:hypothetical protein
MSFPAQRGGRVALRDCGVDVGVEELATVLWTTNADAGPQLQLQRHKSTHFIGSIAPTLVTRGKLVCHTVEAGSSTCFTPVVHRGVDDALAFAVVSLRTVEGRYLQYRAPNYINCSATSLADAAIFRIQLRTRGTDEPEPRAFAPLECCVHIGGAAAAPLLSAEDAVAVGDSTVEVVGDDTATGAAQRSTRGEVPASSARCVRAALMLRDKRSRTWIERWFEVAQPAGEAEGVKNKTLLALPRLQYRETGSPSAPIVAHIPLWTSPPALPSAPPEVCDVNADHPLFSKLASATCHVLQLELPWYFYSPVYLGAYTRAQRDAWRVHIVNTIANFAGDVALSVARRALLSAVENKTIAFTACSDAEHFDHAETQRLRRPWNAVERVAVVVATGALARAAGRLMETNAPPAATLELGNVVARNSVIYPSAVEGGVPAVQEYATVEFDRWTLCGKSNRMTASSVHAMSAAAPPDAPDELPVINRKSSSTAFVDIASLMAAPSQPLRSPGAAATADICPNRARVHVPAEHAPSVLEGLLEKRLDSVAKQAFVGMNKEWGVKHVVLCPAERTLAYVA